MSHHHSTAHSHLRPFPTRRSSDLSWPYASQNQRDCAVIFSAGGRWCRARWLGPRCCAHSCPPGPGPCSGGDRKSTRLNSSHTVISYAVFCLKKTTKNATVRVDP